MKNYIHCIKDSIFSNQKKEQVIKKGNYSEFFNSLKSLFYLTHSFSFILQANYLCSKETVCIIIIKIHRIRMSFL